MEIHFIYETPHSTSNFQMEVFHKFYHKIKELRPDINCVYVNAQSEKKRLGLPMHQFGRYDGYMLEILNPENKKYTLASYGEINHVFCTPGDAGFPYFGFDSTNIVDFITSTSWTNNSVQSKLSEHVMSYNPIPWSYAPINKFVEQYIEDSYNANLPKTIPDRPRYRCHPADWVRQHIMTDSRFDGINKATGSLNSDDYIKELASHRINISTNGNAEICNRDFEIMGLGNVLIRPTLVGKFYDPLIPGKHYIGVDYENYLDLKSVADSLIDTYNRVKQDNELMDYIGKNARDWYVKNGTIDANVDILIKLVDFSKLM